MDCSCPIGSGSTSLSLQSNDGIVLSEDLGSFDLGTNQSLQIISKGDNLDGATLIATRFQNATDPSGVSIQTFSKGGYRTETFLANHQNAGQMFQALGEWDAVALHFGANDAKSVTADEFEQDTRDAITMIRDWAGDSELPILLFSDPDLELNNPARRTEFDLYPSVSATIATDLSNVMAINGRRMTDEAGWLAGSDREHEFLGDGVHYTPYGAGLLADAEVSAILSAVNANSVPEPSAVVLTLATACIWFSRRQRR